MSDRDCFWHHGDDAAWQRYRDSMFWKLHTLTWDHGTGKCCCLDHMESIARRARP